MTYEESKYLADPDFLATVEVYDDTLGSSVPVEVGYAFKSYARTGRKLTGIKIILSPGIHEKQLLFEAVTLEVVPFRRSPPEGVRRPGAKPRRSYQPTASVSR